MESGVTLGKAMFPSLSDIDTLPPHNDHVGYPIVRAETIHQVRSAIFALKIYGKDIDGSVTSLVAGILKDLGDARLSERLASWCGDKPYQGRRSRPLYVHGLTKQYRQQAGEIALDVFFETIWGRSREAFWRWLTKDASLPEFYTTGTNSINRVACSLKPLNGTVFGKLTTFIHYFASADDATKRGHLSQIRKFLQTVLDTPLQVAIKNNTDQVTGHFNLGISDWPEDARHTLACALVANGMYEECLDYNIEEAYKPLFYKFLGGFKEPEDEKMQDGLIELPNVEMPNTIMGAPLSWDQALKKACEDKEWGHLLGVIIRMGLKHSRVQAQTPFAFMEYFSNRLGKAQYGPAIDANNLVLNFVDPPVCGRTGSQSR